MHRFTLYGLGRDDQVLATEQLSVEGAEEARRIARERLGEYPKVELWQASVCLYRRSRGEAAP
jgi:hypothetical protein